MLSCNQCRFCGVKVQGDKSLMKVCRRHPPHVQVVPVPQGGQLALMTTMAWPGVEDSDWCGEYEAKVHLA